jgi:glutaminase
MTTTTTTTETARGSELQALVDDVYEKYAPLREGNVATYIPELSKADPETFGVCVATANGQVFEAGNCDAPFTIQSISKPFTFGMALEELGFDRVMRHVGVEPSGDAFNSIELQNNCNRPFNPMVNSGAITVTALLHQIHGARTFEHVLNRFSAIAGRPLTIDEDVYESERRTGHRNRAIAHLLLNFGVVHDEAEEALDVYFRQCSILVTARDLAMMAATLANGGKNPITGKQVLGVGNVPEVLAVMATAGLYDDSGKWLYRTGLPGKSGVGGGLIAVSPGKFGIAVVSPPLDDAGNSVRAQNAIADISNALGGNPYAPK